MKLFHAQLILCKLIDTLEGGVVSAVHQVITQQSRRWEEEKRETKDRVIDKLRDWNEDRVLGRGEELGRKGKTWCIAKIVPTLTLSFSRRIKKQSSVRLFPRWIHSKCRGVFNCKWMGSQGPRSSPSSQNCAHLRLPSPGNASAVNYGNELSINIKI